MRVKLILIVALSLALASACLAAESSATTRVSWTVLPFAVVGLRGETPGQEVAVTTPLPTPTSGDLARGHIEVPGAVSLSVRSNTRWTVLVEALSPSLGSSHDGTFTWPVESLQIGVGGTFVDVSTHPQTLVSGGRGEHDLTVDYRAQLPENGLPSGEYEAIILYTVTTQ